jgi:hypothetical protein
MEPDEIDQALNEMIEDPAMDTSPVPLKEGSTTEIVSFYQKHSTYLHEHPKVNPGDYLSNVRTMIRKRI